MMTSPKLQGKIGGWIRENILGPEYLDQVDLLSEIDSSLTPSENIALLQKRFPTLWRSEEVERPKQLILVSRLIDKVLSQDKACTYRPKRLAGTYYLVPTRFNGRDRARALIEVFHVEEIQRPEEITDEEARWAGVSGRKDLFELFQKWYGTTSAIKFRNWFRVLESG